MDFVSSPGNITQEDFLAIVGANGTYGGAGVGVGPGVSGTAMFNDSLAAAAAAAAAAASAGTGSTGNGVGPGENLTILPGTYPSGYTLPHIIIASIIVTILMIVIVVGNMLVIIAIATEKTLKNIQNWFIASLAVADFFLGLVIMPFSLANELMGYWIFGNWWCDVHSAMDVLLCTSSIMNLCLISLDRYWSITKAIEYLKSRTPARAAFMIAAVWIMSALVCIPPLLGWKAQRPEGHVELPQCQLSQDIGYVLYSALGSFYIPSCIMVFVYIRIYFAAKARARRGIRKKPLKPPSEQDTSFTRNAGTVPMPSLPSASSNNNQSTAQHPLQLSTGMGGTQPVGNTISGTTQIATIEPPPRGTSSSAGTPMPIPVVTCDFASDMSTSEAATAEQDNHGPISPVGTGGLEPKDTLKVAQPMQQGRSSSTNGITTASSTEPSPSPSATARNRALSVGIDTDMVSEFDPSSSDSGVISRCAVVKPLKFRLCQPIFGKGKAKARQANAKASGGHGGTVGGGRGGNCTQPMLGGTSGSSGGQQAISQLIAAKQTDSACSELEPALPPKPKPRDPEKEKRRIARKKEKRATLILGLIMGSFIACWLPFFFLYILVPVCPDCHIPESAFSLAFWLGYMNSALNPAIYTIFNKDFRRAFRRILFK
ncbi:alpha-2B adrenergic receptor [Anopheles funestus]|uniref:G_PROTEIN_RECEP_F1_2 domain-containing protein n=1 Tax=Anopheles funestus TaxID=62324 RepID=A0A4Y0BKI3_ANOFN|nr:alpha-2B adrenergic receptor [Anopheles funestus]XP_049286896.1 alpha-2B adrenergic receptor [Anopheles funestus]XP_049286903.1 alpha-2B adrenergic receptor [Anopheles funestus]XP_049286910.1 alpha-2B adrenergic receptor [Anopheles funestus]